MNPLFVLRPKRKQRSIKQEHASNSPLMLASSLILLIKWHASSINLFLNSEILLMHLAPNFCFSRKPSTSRTSSAKCKSSSRRNRFVFQRASGKTRSSKRTISTPSKTSLDAKTGKTSSSHPSRSVVEILTIESFSTCFAILAAIWYNPSVACFKESLLRLVRLRSSIRRVSAKLVAALISREPSHICFNTCVASESFSHFWSWSASAARRRSTSSLFAAARTALSTFTLLMMLLWAHS